MCRTALRSPTSSVIHIRPQSFPRPSCLRRIFIKQSCLRCHSVVSQSVPSLSVVSSSSKYMVSNCDLLLVFLRFLMRQSFSLRFTSHFRLIRLVNCGDDLEIGDVAFLGSCSIEGANLENAVVHSIQDYLTKRMEESHKGATYLVVFCNGDSLPSENVDNNQSKGKIFSELLSSMEKSCAKYSVLYVSDPSKSIQYPSYREIQRFLAESTSGNISSNITLCDEVCQIKSSLLEGLLVGIVLLIILISGLCCMMGIDTPTRFETPQES